MLFTLTYVAIAIFVTRFLANDLFKQLKKTQKEEGGDTSIFVSFENIDVDSLPPETRKKFKAEKSEDGGVIMNRNSGIYKIIKLINGKLGSDISSSCVYYTNSDGSKVFSKNVNSYRF